jgi:hypothetical protein
MCTDVRLACPEPVEKACPPVAADNQKICEYVAKIVESLFPKFV